MVAMSVPGYRHVCRVLDADQYSLRRHGNPRALQEYLVVPPIVAQRNVDSSQCPSSVSGKSPKQWPHRDGYALDRAYQGRLPGCGWWLKRALRLFRAEVTAGDQDQDGMAMNSL
jgi:hypothetical protein